jgi:small subunit ribosomal protein S21
VQAELLARSCVFRLLKIKSHFEKPSEKKKREKDENTRRVKKFKKLKARY